MITITLMALLSILFITSSHPVVLLVITVIQTFIISYAIWSKTMNSLLSLILFMIFIGGLMVLFVYVVSLASNEMFNLATESNMTFIFMMLLSFFMMLAFNMNYNNMAHNNYNFLSQYSKIYSSSPEYMIMFTMFYLLMTLIVAVKISNLTETPMKTTLSQ